MNIKEHIEAGHYPKDALGRALVPTTGGRVATICATDKPGEFSIIGWVPTPARAQALEFTWCDLGGTKGMSTDDLLPPPPRKVEVKAWKLVIRGEKVGLTDDPDLARHWRNGLVSDDELIELTGSYEEEWK